ncbi:hypothetical protein ILUMI_23910 [Ignelater luminosus]|uniref:Uncharacterized protein n=1 Tax=Ignelater luminosus TaxID=2038154 RepID=A0A8K0CBJ6_IGNLU|nr:hypothetical protein ILUMI_23910 [Ignelater luminosus]
MAKLNSFQTKDKVEKLIRNFVQKSDTPKERRDEDRVEENNNLKKVAIEGLEDTYRDGSEMDYDVFDDSDADPDFRPGSDVENEVREIPNNNLETDNLDNKTITVIHRRGRRSRKMKLEELETKGGKVVKPRLSKALLKCRKGSTWPSKIKVPQSYKGPIPISSEKKQNVLELLPYVNENFHQFYSNLITKNNLNHPNADYGSEDENDTEEHN